MGLGIFQVRARQNPADNVLLSVKELGQLAQAYLDGEFGPVKVSRL
jgi:hypothetical protein